MRKEVIWAIIAGITLGLVVAFSVYKIETNITLNKKSSPLPQRLIPTPLATQPQEFKIILQSPQNRDVTTQDSVNITGITKPMSLVVVNGEKGDSIIKSDSSGTFLGHVDLTSGVNQLRVTAFDSLANQTSTSLVIVYSASFQEKASSPQTGNATDSAAKQKVMQGSQRPKAYIGTVTDITDSTIELKSMESDIEQVSLDSNVTVLNIAGTNNKQVKASDIAIGDFIVVMGYVGPNSIMAAQRILISDPIVGPKIANLQAKVTDASKKSLTLNTLPDNKEVTITPDKNTDIASFKDGKATSASLTDISEDDTIVYVSEPDDKGNTSIRSIFLLPQN